jgi:hypothetical protein
MEAIMNRSKKISHFPGIERIERAYCFPTLQRASDHSE